MTNVMSRGRRRSVRGRCGATVLVAMCLTAAGCGAADWGGGSGQIAGRVASAALLASQVITVSPAPDAVDVAPDVSVVVTSGTGLLEGVEVTKTDGHRVSGVLSADRRTWSSVEAVRTASTYTVHARAIAGDGSPVARSTTFSTRAVADSDRVSVWQVTPRDGSTVGVAHPVIVEFTRAVRDRAAITRALNIETTPAVEGAWYWIDAATVDWRPNTLWPPGTKVRVRADLRSVDAGGGDWGAGVFTSSFTIGRSQVFEVNVLTHQMTVLRADEVVRRFPVSTGKPGWETRNGTKMIMEKVRGKTWTNEAIDAPEAYTEYSQYALRMTNSGEFIHDAPWNAGLIGTRNASHGCVGMNPADAAWVFENSMVGDPVVVTGSPIAHTNLWNRVQDWNVPWERWLTGNYELTDG